MYTSVIIYTLIFAIFDYILWYSWYILPLIFLNCLGPAGDFLSEPTRPPNDVQAILTTPIIPILLTWLSIKIYNYIHIHIHVYARMCITKYIYIYVYININIISHMIKFLSLCLSLYIYMCDYLSLYIYIYIYIYQYI